MVYPTLRVSVPTTLLSAVVASGLATAPAQAQIVIDDFTTTGNANLYPATQDAASPTTIQSIEDLYGTIADTPAARTVFYTPLLTATQVVNGGFSGQQTISLDTTAGELTSTSTGDGAPFLGFAYTSSSPTAPLNLDASALDALEIRYRSSVAFSALLGLSNFDDQGAIASGNETIIDFAAGSNTLIVPFALIDGVIDRLISGTFPVEFEDLPSIDLSSIDGLSILAGAGDTPVTPEGLVFTLERIAFVPEPTTGLLLSTAGLLAFRRRRA